MSSYTSPVSTGQGVTRRKVTAGLAWTAPAVAVAAAAPASASSPSLTLKITCACKLPGGSCGIPDTKFGYNLYFSASNSGPALTISTITFSQPKDLGATKDANFSLSYTAGAVHVPAGSANLPLEVLANSTNSANQPFYTTMTVVYSHDGYQNDTHTLTYCLIIKDTPPTCLCDTTTNTIVKPTTCNNACVLEGTCPTTPLPTAASCA